MSVKKIFYNTILQSSGKLVSLAIGFASILLLTRYLKESGFGEYTTVITYMGFFGILADLGLYLVTTQLISQDGADEKKILGNVFSLRAITVLAMLLVGAALALALPYSSQVKTAMFIAVLNFAFVSGTQVLVGVFQKYLVFYKLVASEIVGRLVALGTTVLFIYWHLGLGYFILSLTLASILHFVISLTIARRLIPFKLEFDCVLWKSILAKSWPLGFSVVLNLIYFKTDTIILSALKPVEDVGVYGAAYKLFEVLLNFPAMFAGLIMPFLAHFAFREWDKYKLYLQKSFDAILLAIVPMVVVTLFYARPLIDIVGGKGQFTNADKVLKILIFAAAITYLGNLLGYTVVALNTQKKMIWGYLTGAIAGLSLYFLLIPHYSYFGAATATVIVELVVFVFAYFLTSAAAKFYPSFAILFKAFVAAAPMALVFFVLNIYWLVEAALGLAIYIFLLFMLRAIPKELVKELLQRPPAPESALQLNP